MSTRGTESANLDLIYAEMPDEPDGSVQVQHFFGLGHYMRISEIPKGAGAALHVHDYDHQSVVAVGRGRLVSEDGVREIGPGERIEVKAGARHAYIADEDTIWLCIHATSEAEARALYGEPLKA